MKSPKYMCAGSSSFIAGGGVVRDVEQCREVGQASAGTLGGELALGRDEVSMTVVRLSIHRW